MKKTLSLKLFLLLILMGYNHLYADEIWKKDFSKDQDKGYWRNNSVIVGDVDGVTDWTLDVSQCTFANDGNYVKIVSTNSGRLEAVGCWGEAVWKSKSIDISDFFDCSVELKVGETGSSVSESKYVKVFYKVDGGDEIPFEENSNNIGNWGINYPRQTGINGDELVLVVKISNTLSSNKVYFDNIVVSGNVPDSGSEVLSSDWSTQETIISSLAIREQDAIEAFHFKIADFAEDELPTIIQKMRIVPTEANNVIWEK